MRDQQSGQVVIDAATGLLLGGGLGLVLGGLLPLDGPFHRVFGVRFGTASGAVAGAIAAAAAPRVGSALGRAAVVAAAAVAGAVACLPVPALDIWPDHFAAAVAGLRSVEVLGVGLAYGAAVGLVIAWFNGRRPRRDRAGEPGTRRAAEDRVTAIAELGVAPDPRRHNGSGGP